jgi:IclR family pca regulon transcriptional regulator
MARLAGSLDRSFISSLSHGLSVLEAVADGDGVIGLAALSKRLGFNKTSTWRLAHTLVDLGYLHQDPDTRNFRPAPRILALGYSYFDGLDLKHLSLPHLHQLSTRHNETVSLAVRSGDELIYIDRTSTSHVVSINVHIGTRLPLSCTSLGRALICEMPADWVEEYLERIANDPKTPKQALVEPKRLLQRLADARERGYTVNDEELVKGMRAVSSPVRDKTGKVVAAVGVAVASSRVSVVDLSRVFAPDLIETAEKISLALGYRPAKTARESEPRRTSVKEKKATRRRAD